MTTLTLKICYVPSRCKSVKYFQYKTSIEIDYRYIFEEAKEPRIESYRYQNVYLQYSPITTSITGQKITYLMGLRKDEDILQVQHNGLCAKPKRIQNLQKEPVSTHCATPMPPTI